MTTRLLLPLAAVIAVCACDGAQREANTTAPVLIGEVILEESDSAFIGKLGALKLTHDKSVVVSDLSSASVLVYSPTGKLMRRLGRRGKGPGEFVAPVAFAVSNDNRLAVEDAALRRTAEFSLTDGEMLRSLTHSGDVFSLAYGERGLHGAMFNLNDSLALVALNDSARVFGSIPRSLQTSGARIFLRFAVVSTGPGPMITGYPGVDALFIDSRSGRQDSIRMPKQHRVGGSPDVLRRLRENPALSSDSVDVSWPVEIRWLDTRQLVALYLDPPTKRRQAQCFLTMVTVDERGQILNDGNTHIDLRVPLDSPDGFVATLTDSSVAVLEQIVTSGDKPIARLREYRIP